MKYKIGHPLSGQTCNRNITDVELGDISEVAVGTPGGWP